MDRRQVKFLLIVAFSVVLFAFVLAILNLFRQPYISQTETGLTPTIVMLPVTAENKPSPRPAATQSSQKVVEPGQASPTAQPPATATPEPKISRQFYVSPQGSQENDGSQEHPWPIQYVLDGPPVILPGDTIWVTAGKYTGPFTVNLNGAQGKPVIVRAIPGARAILESSDLVLDIQNSTYINLWGLEITATGNSRDPVNRDEGAYGIRIHQGSRSHDIKFINLIIHDMPAQGIGWWPANWDSEVYGSLIFYNGVNQFDHGLYVRNIKGQKSIVDNFIFDNASHGIHAYGEKDYPELNNIHIEGNTVFDNGSIGYTTRSRQWGDFKRNILVGGFFTTENPTIIDNYTYFPGATGESLNLGYRGGSNAAVVEDNYFAGGQVRLGGANQNMHFEKNTFLGFSLPDLSLRGNDFQIFRPANAKVFIRPNQFEAGRANITIYNWGKKPSIIITADDLHGVKMNSGDHYEIHNVQDYFSDIITGIYDGRQIEIPMNGHTVAQPLGLNFKPPSTFPDFGAFVLFTVPSDK